MKQFEANAQPVSTQYSATYQVATREDQFDVPKAKALFAGGVITLLTATITGVVLLLLHLALAAWFHVSIPGVVYGLAVLLVILVGLWQVYAHFQQYEQNAVWLIEKILDHDINGDGVEGKPEQDSTAHVTVHLNGYQARHGDLPYESQHKQLAEGLLDGRAFSRRSWCPNNYKVNLSQPQFEELQQAFVDVGMANWKNENYHQVGAVLTTAGVDYCEKLTGRKATPELLQKLGIVK